MGTPGLALPLPKGSCKLVALSAPRFCMESINVGLWPRGHRSSAEVGKPFPILTPENAEYQDCNQYCCLQRIPGHQAIIWVHERSAPPLSPAVVSWEVTDM